MSAIPTYGLTPAERLQILTSRYLAFDMKLQSCPPKERPHIVNMLDQCDYALGWAQYDLAETARQALRRPAVQAKPS